VEGPVNQEPFYVRLRRMRLARGYRSMAELAVAIDVSPQAVSGWELGRYRPSWEDLRHLSRALGSSVEELMFGPERWDVRDEWVARAGQEAREYLKREIAAIKAEANSAPLYKPDGII
jgi:transcriptional regulator with XRE-family HTH domain